MSTELTGTATYRATVTAPVDGDTRNAASVQAGLQDCADSLAFHDGVLKGTTAWPSFSTIQIQPGTFGSAPFGIVYVNTDNTYFAGKVRFNGGLYASGNETVFNSGAQFANGAYAYSGVGRPVYRLITLTDANATLNITVGDMWRMPAGTLTTARTLTLGATGAQVGNRITVTRWGDNGAFDLFVKNTAAAALITLTTTITGAEFVHDGTDWVVIGRYA